MTNLQIQQVASMLTDDPDILLENDMDNEQDVVEPGAEKPLSPTEIDKEAMDAAGSEDASQEVADQLKQQQDLQKQQDTERQRILEPQLQDLNTTMGALQAGVLQGKDQSDSSNQAFSQMDQELGSLQALIQNLEKSI